VFGHSAYLSFATANVLACLVCALLWKGVRWLTVTWKLDKFIERFARIIGYGATLIALAAAYYTEPSRLQKIEAVWYQAHLNSTLCWAYVSTTPGKTYKDFPNVCLPPPPED
jgi:hypothetical protein